MASPKEKTKKFFKDLKKNEDVTVRRILKGARTAAKNVMNNLAERGPEYSGIFKDSWRVKAIDFGKNSGIPQGEYPYNIADVPRLVGGRKAAFNVFFGRPTLTIFNIQKDYVEIALDLKRGKFRPDMLSNGQPIPPIGKVVKKGARGSDKIFRGEFVGPGEGKSTARANWFTTYTKGGKLKNAVEKGVRIGYKGL
jgi:hypothetical protein